MNDVTLILDAINRGLSPAKVTAKWADLGLHGSQKVRDLWKQQDLGVFKDQYQATVPRHGCVMVRIWPQQ
jgi:alpha-galactosidase